MCLIFISASASDVLLRLPKKNGVLDWDCAEAIDVSAMAEALSYIRSHATVPVRATIFFLLTKNLPDC
jgi:uridine kinase